MVGGERAAALVILCFERAEEWFETKSSALSNGIKRNQNESKRNQSLVTKRKWRLVIKQ